ncbi:hypothetical protein EVG20_g3535 [Dentipellis fragilis]|uniref:Uncharacterized protein n=1 Tax=Dentipellis fragilis TaxID=205917 RepID=A0A4Y9Z576_9AGAM|nr:hypothetical protein EVG20_g3535 [Dentipellis fragilis]
MSTLDALARISRRVRLFETSLILGSSRPLRAIAWPNFTAPSAALSLHQLDEHSALSQPEYGKLKGVLFESASRLSPSIIMFKPRCHVQSPQCGSPARRVRVHADRDAYNAIWAFAPSQTVSVADRAIGRMDRISFPGDLAARRARNWDTGRALGARVARRGECVYVRMKTCSAHFGHSGYRSKATGHPKSVAGFLRCSVAVGRDVTARVFSKGTTRSLAMSPRARTQGFDTGHLQSVADFTLHRGCWTRMSQRVFSKGTTRSLAVSSRWQRDLTSELAEGKAGYVVAASPLGRATVGARVQAQVEDLSQRSLTAFPRACKRRLDTGAHRRRATVGYVTLRAGGGRGSGRRHGTPEGWMRTHKALVVDLGSLKTSLDHWSTGNALERRAGACVRLASMLELTDGEAQDIGSTYLKGRGWTPELAEGEAQDAIAARLKGDHVVLRVQAEDEHRTRCYAFSVRVRARAPFRMADTPRGAPAAILDIEKVYRAAPVHPGPDHEKRLVVTRTAASSVSEAAPPRSRRSHDRARLGWRQREAAHHSLASPLPETLHLSQVSRSPFSRSL